MGCVEERRSHTSPGDPKSILKPSAAQSIAGKRCGACGRAPWRPSPVTLRVYLFLLWDSSPKLFGVDAGALPHDKAAQRGKEDWSRSAERTEPRGCREALFVSSLAPGGGFHARSHGRSAPLGGGRWQDPSRCALLLPHAVATGTSPTRSWPAAGLAPKRGSHRLVTMSVVYRNKARLGSREDVHICLVSVRPLDLLRRLPANEQRQAGG